MVLGELCEGMTQAICLTIDAKEAVTMVVL